MMQLASILLVLAGAGPGLPMVDLDGRSEFHVVVDREKGQYLGHPTTLLLEDGRTVLCVYPKGHGKGAIVFKRSSDGGKTWSERLPTPASWATSKETPTIHRLIGPDGRKRIVLFSGLYPIRSAISEDDGLTWSELKPVGHWGGIVAMASVVELKTGPGHYLAMFHDDGRYFAENGQRSPTFTLYQSITTDGGLTWQIPTVVYSSADVHLCEPGIIRSPDGKQLAALLRENRRVKNSHVIFSDDEGKSWSSPRELPVTLTGDRHVGQYAADGRLLLSFRDMNKISPTYGDWVGWVGSYQDLVTGNPGQYRIRFKKNHVRQDCAYPGVERLPDNTLIVTTYGHWDAGESPYIRSVRFRLQDTDRLVPPY